MPPNRPTFIIPSTDSPGLTFDSSAKLFTCVFREKEGYGKKRVLPPFSVRRNAKGEGTAGDDSRGWSERIYPCQRYLEFLEFRVFLMDWLGKKDFCSIEGVFLLFLEESCSEIPKVLDVRVFRFEGRERPSQEDAYPNDLRTFTESVFRDFLKDLLNDFWENVTFTAVTTIG
eukprot:TRINITY_DN7086_c0_g1_i3.p1 TRINITY_DN7086_c0_g1~~TRINITY_DN7086_c0_g1_i3.p1  ORF type:complete len:172 (+),score=15.32 TRINITY_DN7086_c0_g1_i3:411-926(+)